MGNLNFNLHIPEEVSKEKRVIGNNSIVQKAGFARGLKRLEEKKKKKKKKKKGRDN